LLIRCLLIENMDIRYDSEHCLVIIENRILRFSPTEYKLIHLLLIHRIVTEAALLEGLSLQHTDAAALKLISKYMSRVRGRVKAYGLQISRVYGYGYMLLSSQEDFIQSVD
jgi:DNA-binding response OmpR family regulator